MPPISVLIKPASGQCNLRCEYCFYHDEMRNRSVSNYRFMSEDTFDVVIQKTLSHAETACTIAFQGGEPTLVGLPFFEKVVTLQKKHNISGVRLQNTIQTNGIGIDNQWAAFLARNNFLTGLSLDGVRATHDAYRKDAHGQGTFYRVMETALLLDKHKVDYNILTVINSKTALNADRIYRFYQKRGFKYLQFITCLDPIGCIPGGCGYSLTPESYGVFLCKLFDLWYDDLLMGCQPYIRSFENYIAILCGIPTESCDMQGVCGIQYLVEADGSVYPCDFYALDEYRLGNLLTDSYAQIDIKREELGFIRRSEKLPPECPTCRYFMLCRGGCARLRIPHGGETVNCFCSSYHRFFDHAGERMHKIADCIKRVR